MLQWTLVPRSSAALLPVAAVFQILPGWRLTLLHTRTRTSQMLVLLANIGPELWTTLLLLFLETVEGCLLLCTVGLLWSDGS